MPECSRRTRLAAPSTRGYDPDSDIRELLQ